MSELVPTNEYQDLEERYGPVMAQYIVDQLTQTQRMTAANIPAYAKAA